MNEERAPVTAERPESRPRRWPVLAEMAVLFAVALAIALLAKSFVVQPFYIPSQSMENTLLVGDKILVNKLVYRIRPIGRGDIVVFSGAGSWDQGTPPAADAHRGFIGAMFGSIRDLFETSPGQTDYIKRVIGLPGDHVACCTSGGLITVNGIPLHESSYLYPDARPSQGRFSVIVPPGRLWVMGDNRAVSADSRLHDCAYTYLPPQCDADDRDGTIPESSVVGRAFMIILPLNRVRVLGVPQVFSQLGPARAGKARRAVPGPASALSGLTVRPSAPVLPVAAGLAAAVPLTLARRAVRRRRRAVGRRGP